MRTLLIFLFSCLAFSACHRTANCTKTLVCTHKTITPVLGGFDSSQIDTVVLYTFTADSTFNTLLSQRVCTLPHVLSNIPGSTTDTIAFAFDSLELKVGYDYKLYIPHAGASYRFYHIADTGFSVNAPCDNASTTCYTVINKCTVTGNNFICGTGGASVYVMLKP